VSRAGARAIALAALAAVAVACGPAAQILPPELRHVVALPRFDNSIQFAVIGDTGTGNLPQYQVAERMVEARENFPFEFVIMLGDNLYGLERPVDYERKFAVPYAKLLDEKVEFYASLGNHDNPNQRFYENFHMGGERYYAFSKGPARFFALDSNYMTEEQVAWLIRELKATRQPWKIAFFHHPLYSSGGFHGSSLGLRERLEPIFVKYGVRVVFSGHEHFYERIKPQHGVYYFIAGGSARLRRNDINSDELTAAGFDTDNSFMLVEIEDDELYFETISRTGELVESGEIARSDEKAPETGTTEQLAPAKRGQSGTGAKERPAPARGAASGS
jgi:hypothetical protein